MSTRLLIMLLASVVAGCAASGTGETRPRQDPNLITLDELRTAPRTNALDLVQTLRPRWLRVRGPTSFDAARENVVAVYVDGTRYGGPQQLRAIAVPAIESMQYLNPTDASSRFGFDHMNGAILVTTRSGPDR